MIKLDIKTKIISATQRIWLIHPGKGREYYKLFKEKNMVFLSMPGLDLDITDNNSAPVIRQKIRMSLAIQEHYKNADDAVLGPSTDHKTYESAPGKEVNSDVANVQGLYFSASPGDLVIVTNYGYYEPILIGEFTEKYSATHEVEFPKLPNVKVPYRRVKWINVGSAKINFSENLSNHLVNRRAVVQIRDIAAKREIYDFAYSSYVVGNEGKVDLLGPNYNGKRIGSLSASEKLIGYFVAAHSATLKGEVSAFNLLDLDQAIEKYYDGDLIENFAIEFHSPGKFVLSAAGTLTMLVLLGVATFTSNANEADIAGDIKIENTLDEAALPEFKDVCDNYKALLKSMKKSNRCELKKLGDEAANNIGLRTSAKVAIK